MDRVSKRGLALFLAEMSLLVVGSLSVIILPDWNVPVPAFWSKPSINNMPAVSVIAVAPKPFDDPIALSPSDEPGLENAIRDLAEIEKSKMLKIEGVETVQMPPEFEGIEMGSAERNYKSSRRCQLAHQVRSAADRWSRHHARHKFRRLRPRPRDRMVRRRLCHRIVADGGPRCFERD